MTGNRNMIGKLPRGSGPLLKLVHSQAKSSSGRPLAFTPLEKLGKRQRWLYTLFHQGVFLLLGLLLGRAVILNTFMPFVLPAFAVSLHLRKHNSFWLAVGLTIGAATALPNGGDPVLVLAMILSYLLLLSLVKRFDFVDTYHLPLLVMIIDMGFRFGFSLPGNGFTEYGLAVAVIEGVLAWLLAYMFLQIPPLLMTVSKRPWKIEETIAIVILLASVLSGLQGLQIHGVFIESLVARYVLLLFAAAGGAGIGGAIGIVTGVILALGSSAFSGLIGVFGFAGVLAGLLHEAKKPVIAVGFLVGSGILTLYVANHGLLYGQIFENVAAVLLFFLTPNRLIQAGSRMLPGTARHALSQQENVRKIKTLMTSRIQEIASLFTQLSGSFKDDLDESSKSDVVATQMIDRTVKQLCEHCHYKARCWEKNAVTTWYALEELVHTLDVKPGITKEDIPMALVNRCTKPELLLSTLKDSRSLVNRHLTLLQQLRESRQIVADQLSGVATIMLDLAEKIELETGANHKQEEAILHAFSQLGLEVENVEIVSLEEGKIEIEVLQLHPSVHDEPGKLVAPLLSEILGETITVRSVEPELDHSAQRIRLSSARQYQVSSGFASVAKDGTLKSGDSFSVVDVGNGKCAIALSDGMGNGERANQESSAAVKLVQQLLRAGFPEEVAIKTVNSALVLRSPDEMYATLDLAIIDLFTARTEFLKVGSVPSFVKQKDRVLVVRGESLPIGILDEIEIQTKSMDLHDEDLMVFMSDGIFEALFQLPEPEEWVRQQLGKFSAADPQRLADWLLEAAVRTAGGVIRDDMTIVCARIERYKPGWATIRLPQMPTIRTNKDRKRLQKASEKQTASQGLHDVFVRVGHG